MNNPVSASVEKESANVSCDACDDALRRYRERKRTWGVLFDSNKDWLRLLKKTARERGVTITEIVDLIHALEYLWKVAYAFRPDGSKDAET